MKKNDLIKKRTNAIKILKIEVRIVEAIAPYIQISEIPEIY